MKATIYFLIFIFHLKVAYAQDAGHPYIQILGIVQDGGYPHAGCVKKCCAKEWQHGTPAKFITSFVLVDSAANKWWLFEATPDIKYQLKYFKDLTHGQFPYLPEGILITHAHIGHYTGLMQFGREVMNTKELPVYVLPRMKTYLEANGPWSQLVKLKNIELRTLQEDKTLELSEKIRVETFRVPHRDEYSETAGFKIITGNKKYLFIPDIDKWETWSRNIIEEVKSVGVALIDGTFYDNDELPGRKISEVPHPLVSETMKLFEHQSTYIKSTIFFIHLNHTNRLLWDREAQEEFKKSGFNLASQGERY